MKNLLLFTLLIGILAFIGLFTLPDDKHIDLSRLRKVGGVIEVISESGSRKVVLAIAPNSGVVTVQLSDGKYIIYNVDPACERQLYEREKITIENGKISWHEVSTGTCQ